MKLKDLIDILITLSGVINVFAFVAYNKKRISKITNALEAAYSIEINPARKRQIAALLDNYGSFFGYVLGFPNPQKHGYLYSNPSLQKSYQSSKPVFIYFGVFLVGFILLNLYLDTILFSF
ncbi:hypothetical protein [Hymenobacter sp. BT559]|uniref:hypothetical protein n=1 Tax=Hymenobacter sp. BT559 TaxID=2795729 RepID=UPI0018EC9DB7|nr:hypothetical protein [Hymenobacter sp. BT559]MBJ6142475.1 hypothetical protein [Hymenobacter sp. BT559]